MANRLGIVVDIYFCSAHSFFAIKVEMGGQTTQL